MCLEKCTEPPVLRKKKLFWYLKNMVDIFKTVIILLGSKQQQLYVYI